MRCSQVAVHSVYVTLSILHYFHRRENHGFTKINIAEQFLNPFEKIGKQWMLISAGNANSWNTMTASWGGVGIIWGKPSATCYIRHSRYTMEFVDSNEYFTLTFLKDGHRDALNLLGTNPAAIWIRCMTAA